jgi:hypothetical protein
VVVGLAGDRWISRYDSHLTIQIAALDKSRR